MPKENSKSHKAKEANKWEYERVVCEKCGAADVTLYKTFFGTYRCAKSKNSCEFRQGNKNSWKNKNFMI